MRPAHTLWHHPNFLRLWAAQSISQFGSQVTALALPLTAVLILEATPFQMGVLTAAGSLPHLLIALFAGVWIDRVPRRPVLVGADLGRMALLLVVPLAVAVGILHIGLLYAVALGVGVLTVFFDIAYQAYLPALVGRQHLIEANSKLQLSHSAALISGPGLGGALVQVITAPLALMVDALSFLLSGFFVWRIRTHEPAPIQGKEREGMWQEIARGLRLVLGNRLLRAIAAYQATGNLFTQMSAAVLVLYAIRSLKLEPGLLGLIFAAGSGGFLVGVLLAGRVKRRYGAGPAIIAGAALTSVGNLFIPLAQGSVAVPLLILGLSLMGMGETIFSVNQMSLRQGLTPDPLQGRMNATMRFLTWSSRPVGAVIGGVLGEQIGLHSTLIVAAVGSLLALPWVYCSPLRSLAAQRENADSV